MEKLEQNREHYFSQIRVDKQTRNTTRRRGGLRHRSYRRRRDLMTVMIRGAKRAGVRAGRRRSHARFNADVESPRADRDPNTGRCANVLTT
ncbi:hypothetical protein EVAR_63047_1 [Eumeta japonica]|uniref:Uncharacterized protein n=1 Tax=Eumeta variegata TaxID=151549 RepID=A0A4C1Z1W9_EUMVA|nr:hypothetical protein EVAR_63047_1 [Eumeta japonica]